MIWSCLEYCSHVWGDFLLPISLTWRRQKHFASLMHITSPLNWSRAVMLLLFLSYKSFILVVARKSLVIVCPVLKTVGTILGLLLLHMDFVLKLTTLASIDVILASSHTQATCGILYVLLFFLPLTIYLHLNVGCMGTLEALTEYFLFIIFYSNLTYMDIFLLQWKILVIQF